MSSIAQRYKYFLFSREQFQMRKQIENSRNRDYIPGRVMNKGKWRDFTEISETPTNRFSDAVIVAEGYIEKMEYQRENTDWRPR